MTAKSQNMTVLDHLKKGEVITSMMAIHRYGITRLSGRIYDLRAMGHNIVSTMIEPENGSAFGKFAEYKLEENNQPEMQA